MHYQLIDAKGSLLEEGDATINVTKELVLITPKQGQPFPIKLTDIQSILEPIAYSIAIVLKDGSKIQMSQLGNMRTQILAQINDLKQTNAKESFLLVGIGNPDKFKGLTNGVKSDVFLYDDALVSLPYEGDPIQFLYSFVDNIEVDQSGYNIQITLHDGSQIKLSQFAQFTQSMIRVLNQKVSDVKVRTSSFLSSLLPGLTALQVRSLAMELRDGVLAPVSKLNAIDPTVFQVLSDAACLNERKECLDQLIKLGTSWIGFKQVISVEKNGTGGQPWQDATHQPILDHGGQYSGPQGLAGAMMAGLISQGPPWGAGYGFQGPFFERGSDLAYEMLGMRMGAMGMGAMGMGAMGMGAMGAQNQHQIAERKIPQIANMTAKSSDYSKLTVGVATVDQVSNYTYL
jgi:hypothetical protein